jgi:ribosome biogenesis protein SSF1/2
MKLEDNTNTKFNTYIKAAKFYNVTHLVAFQNSKNSIFVYNLGDYLRIMKIGAGEMIFRLMSYCRMKDVLHHGGQPFSLAFKDPLVIVSNFSETVQLKMIGKSLQEMFPPINPEKLKVDRLKRVILFNYNSHKKIIYFRHYKIIIPQKSSTKQFSKLLNEKSLNLANFASIG